MSPDEMTPRKKRMNAPLEALWTDKIYSKKKKKKNLFSEIYGLVGKRPHDVILQNWTELIQKATFDVDPIKICGCCCSYSLIVTPNEDLPPGQTPRLYRPLELIEYIALYYFACLRVIDICAHADGLLPCILLQCLFTIQFH